MTRYASSAYQGRALRTEEPRRSARGAVVRVARTIALALGMTVLALIAPAVEEAVVTAPLFAVRAVEVRGARQLGDENVRRLAGLSVGMPLVAVDADAAERSLSSVPRIASAEVDRRVWGRVVVQVNERVPCALVLPMVRSADGEQRPLEVDRDGMLMDPIDPMRWPDLPLVTGLVGRGARAGQVVPHARFGALATLLTLLQRPDIDLADRVSSIDVAQDSGWTITMAGSGVTVRLPERTVDARDLLALRTTLQDVEARGPVGGEIDMRFRGQLIWRPAPGTPPDSTATPEETTVADAAPITTHAELAAATRTRTQTTQDDTHVRNTRGGRNATW